jgi:crotonobetaine/carnitine-CoA ligase
MTDLPAPGATITALLERAAASAPSSVFLRTEEGELDYGSALDRSARLATALGELGVRRGTPVALLMGNGIDQILLWFALARIGALHVPLNSALVGDRLVHALNVCAAELLVVDHDLLPGAASALRGLRSLRRTVVRGPRSGLPDTGLPVTDFAALCTPRPPAPAAQVDELAPATLLFTSGTTGVSKACVLSHRYLARQGQIHARHLGLGAEDVLYTPFPLFHIDAATLTTVAALAVGATAALGRRFSASRFWDEVRRFDATVFNFMGATLTILWKRPPTPADRDHRVRMAWGVPMPAWKAGWEERFGFPLLQVYGLTDGGVPVYDDLEAGQRPGACGRVIPEFELRIADENGMMLPAGRTGEILVRGREPGLVMNGYHAMPEATAAVFRDGWLRTGDLGRLDEDGYLYFAGRSSDSIRRRGENISAFEVEELAEGHPDVVEAAAVGVPSELTEEDVKIFVVRRPGSTLTAAELHAHLRRVSPRFMVPRYIEFADSLPRTPTEKVEKFKLHERGNGPRTWDAEAGTG